MQTFLPYPDFQQTAKCLDFRRLGKQRVEAWQIWKACVFKDYAWRKHPISKMWKGYEACLLDYGIAICKEWRKRGYKDNMLRRFKALRKLYGKTEKPHWLGNKALHASHRSNLLRKDKDFYGKYGWQEKDNLLYVWEVK